MERNHSDFSGKRLPPLRTFSSRPNNIEGKHRNINKRRNINRAKTAPQILTIEKNRNNIESSSSSEEEANGVLITSLPFHKLLIKGREKPYRGNYSSESDDEW